MRLEIKSGKIVMTEEIARAIAWDAGNRAMRAAGRTRWSQDDFHAAAQELLRLVPMTRGEQ